MNDRIETDDGYTDSPVTFYRVTVFGSRAENAAASFTKGDIVVAAGPPATACPAGPPVTP